MVNKQKGFTLIELLVVIAIIGLLSTLAVVALNSARSKARDAKRVSDIKQIQTGLELHYADNTGYPGETASSDLGVTGSNYACLYSGGFEAIGASCVNPYMPIVPAQSQTGLAATDFYHYTATDSGGSACTSGNSCASYFIDFATEASPAGYPTGCANGYRATPSGVICDPDAAD